MATETACAGPVVLSSRSPGATSSRCMSTVTPSARNSLKPLPALPMILPASVLGTSSLSVTVAAAEALSPAESRSHMLAMQRCCASSGGLTTSIRPPTTKSRVSVKVEPVPSRSCFSPAPALPTIEPILSPSRISLASSGVEAIGPMCSVIIGCVMYGLGSAAGACSIADGGVKKHCCTGREYVPGTKSSGSFRLFVMPAAAPLPPPSISSRTSCCARWSCSGAPTISMDLSPVAVSSLGTITFTPASCPSLRSPEPPWPITEPILSAGTERVRDDALSMLLCCASCVPRSILSPE
mmetsp:Transcript_8185/g.19211  ORF Transcript_8185/g.19211 Transcript_8185/m.19211 type:complete len:296 (+) Transcript_8185:196-1083(+)